MLSAEEEVAFQKIANSYDYRFDMNEFFAACRRVQDGDIPVTVKRQWDRERRIVIRRRVRKTVQIASIAFLAATAYRMLENHEEEE